MSDAQAQWERDTRDLLVRLSTQVEGIRADLKELKDTNAGKLDRTEANRLQAEAMEIHTDHEARLRFIEKYMWLGLGGITVLTFILNYFQPFSHVTIK